MKTNCIFRTFFLVVLILLFLWQTMYATLKYLERTTIASTTYIDHGSISFPSITVCKKYSNGPSLRKIINSSISIGAKINQLHMKTWRRNEVFFFFSHSGMFNLSFPCTTKDSQGTNPGKPCSFPFLNFDGKPTEKCIADMGFCYTRYLHII